MKYKLIFSLIFILAVSMVSAGGTITAALTDLCKILYEVVGTLASVMILLSSVVYAGGQMFGAEMRARAHVWSQSLLSGAVIGIIMIVIVPNVLGAMLGMTFDANSCTFS